MSNFYEITEVPAMLWIILIIFIGLDKLLSRGYSEKIVASTSSIFGEKWNENILLNIALMCGFGFSVLYFLLRNTFGSYKSCPNETLGDLSCMVQNIIFTPFVIWGSLAVFLLTFIYQKNLPANEDNKSI